MSIRSKQQVLSVLRAALLECNGYDELCSDLSDVICKFEGKPIVPLVEIKDPVIVELDQYLDKYKKTIKYTKFAKVSDALLEGHMYPVLISVNNVCYALESEDLWVRFRSIIEVICKQDGFNCSTINIYHIIPPNAERKARLQYKSVNKDELQLVKERIAEITGSSVDSIDISEMSEKESCITLADRMGTQRDTEGIVDKICYQLLSKFKDGKPQPFPDVKIGDVLCQADPIHVSKVRNGRYYDVVIPTTINHYNINLNVINGNHTTIGDQHVGDATTTTTTVVKPKKKRTEDIAEEWIEAHPYKNTKTRGDYYNKYVKHMNKENKQYLSVQKFSGVMRECGYKEAKKGNIRVWEKIDDIDSDSECEKHDDLSSDEE